MTVRRASRLLVAGAAFALPLALLPAGSPVARAAAPSFVHGVLPPPPPGSTAAYNVAAEPAVRSDPAGRFYISSENGLGAGTDAWASADGGRSYASLPQPNRISSADASSTTGLAPGGGDTDLAVAPAKNGTTSNSRYNVYVASLTLGSVTVSASGDGGQSWQSNELGATVPGDDREWIAAQGADTYYVSYHNISSGDQIIVNEGRLENGTPVSAGTYSAINPAQTDIYLGTYLDNQLGNLQVDQSTGLVYQVFVGCPPGPTQVTSCGNLNTVYMAVGTPTGVNAAGLPVLSFHDYVVYQDERAVDLDHNFPNVAVDHAGNAYVAWSDDHHVYVSHSTSHGRRWSAPQQASGHIAASKTAIFPWLTAGAGGKVDLVYYGTPAPQNYQTCASGKPGKYDCQNEPWRVVFAQNLDATGDGTWQEQVATDVVHYGGACEGGVSCTSSGNDNRDLYDDFGVAASPATGLASITYSDDQYADNVGTANAGECTQAQDNTSACDHTDYATQTNGAGIW